MAETDKPAPKATSPKLPWVHLGLAAAFVIAVVIVLKYTASALGNLVSINNGQQAWKALLFLLVVAFVTMSLIQVFRSLVRVRGTFHRQQVEKWFESAERTIADYIKISAPPPQASTSAQVTMDAQKSTKASQAIVKSPQEAAKDDIDALMRFVNVDDSEMFFDAPIEQVCGQLGAVAEFLLSSLYPDPQNKLPGNAPPAEGPEHDRLLAVLTGKNQVVDAAKLLGLPWAKSGPTATSRTSDHTRKQLGYYVQRSLDQLQIAVSSRWQRRLRLAAVLLSCAISLSASTYSSPFSNNVSKGEAVKSDLAGFLTAILAGIVSGYLATVFRDLISILERMRRG